MDLQTKILFLDLDGTVLNDDEVVPEENIIAIKKAQAAGIKVVVATGRSRFESQYVLDAIQPDYFSGMNGAVIYDLKTDELIYQRVMEPELIQRMMTLMDSLGIGYLLQTHQGTFYPTTVPIELSFKACKEAFLTRFKEFFKPLGSDFAQLGISKFFAMAASDKDADRFLAELVDFDVVALPVLENGYDVLPKGQDKAVSVRMLCEMFGIAASQAAAIGDSANDIDMLRFVDCGIALANAAPDVKSISQHIAPSNNEAGVAYAIYNILGV